MFALQTSAPELNKAMIKPADLKLWQDVMAGVQRLVPKSVRHDPPKMRIPIRDVRPRHTIDLHGLTVQEAYRAGLTFVQDGRDAGFKHVTVITGLSGQIRQEFQQWMRQLDYVREVSPVNGGGAFKVRFYRKR